VSASDTFRQLAENARRAADLFEDLAQAYQGPQSADEMPATERVALNEEHVGHLVDATGKAPCGCDPWILCRHHEQSRPKGCRCHSDYFPSLTCSQAAHKHAARTGPRFIE